MIGGNYAGTTAQIGLGALRKAAIPQNQPNLGVLMGEAIGAYNKKKENEDLFNKQQAYADALKSGDQEAIKNAWIDLDAAGYADYANKQAEVEAQRAFQEKMQQQAFNNQWGLAKYRERMAQNAIDDENASLQNALDSGLITQEEYNQKKRSQILGDIAKGGQPFDGKGAMDLRKEFVANNKDYFQIGDMYGKVRSAAQDPSAAGDISLIFGYMKMLDTGSVVREGEFANAQNAAGVPQRVINAYNKALTGTRLSPEQRKDFLNQADKIYKNQQKKFKTDADWYSSIARQQGIDPQYVVHDPYDYDQPQVQEGSVIQDANGNKMVLRGGQWQPM